MRNFARTHLAALAAGICVFIVVVSATTTVSAQWGGGQSRWKNILDTPAEFYGSEDSIRIADEVLAYQSANGGWAKNIDMAAKLSDGEMAKLIKSRNTAETTIDNGATWTQIRFLALMHAATGQQRFADAANRGIEYLLAAQYPNGGWPQFFPLKKGYYSHITYNDGAMIGAMTLLRDAAKGKQPFEFVDAALRERCQTAIDKGLDVILKTQVVVDGKPTVWCAQYDESTLEPAPARAYELVSLSGYESAGIVKYLMKINNPSPEVKRAIDNAIDWFNHSKIEGQAIEWKRDANTGRPLDRVVVTDPNADPIWARFYTIGANRPMFVGRDGIIHDHLADIELERRVGYAWLGDWPNDILEKYPKWQAKWNN